MEEAIRFLLEHAYVVLFLSVSADKLGLPVPSVPVLLAMGALSGSGEFSLAAALPLHRLGVTRVRPLSGGFDAWVEGGFPLETKTAAASLFAEIG
jgi:3-mercaptopyruvate sulfurtransferase SseA